MRPCLLLCFCPGGGSASSRLVRCGFQRAGPKYITYSPSLSLSVSLLYLLLQKCAAGREKMQWKNWHRFKAPPQSHDITNRFFGFGFVQTHIYFFYLWISSITSSLARIYLHFLRINFYLVSKFNRKFCLFVSILIRCTVTTFTVLPNCRIIHTTTTCTTSSIIWVDQWIRWRCLVIRINYIRTAESNSCNLLNHTIHPTSLSNSSTQATRIVCNTTDRVRNYNSIEL